MVVEFVMAGEVFFLAAPLFYLMGRALYDPILWALYF